MEEIKNFLLVDEYRAVDGSGNGDGYGDADGYGDGSGDGSGYGYGDADGYGDGYGAGYGYGVGDGCGNGYGVVDGVGDGSGNGDGYGCGDCGDGSGSGYDVVKFNGQKVYEIDEITTIINSVHENSYARGYILNNDLTTTPCYIAKCGSFFAHGESLKEALSYAKEKYRENKPLEERIAEFNKKYPDEDIPIDGKELFSWHHILTGSCLFGREQFVKDHGLDVNAKYTVRQFINLTKDAFGKDIIKQLIKSRIK